MKAAIWLPSFDRFELNKCYGQIAIGLTENGIETYLVSSGKGELTLPESKIAILGKISDEEFSKISSQFDFVIMYTWFSSKYRNLVEEVAKRTKVIIKCDSDGRNYSFSRKKIPGSLLYAYKKIYTPKNFLRVIKFELKQLMVKMSRNVRERVFGGFISQIRIAHRVVIESPHAAYNLIQGMGKLGMFSEMKKIVVIPNPVSDNFLNISLSEIQSKENIVLSIGRWDDIRPKNPEDLVRAILGFLRLKKNWRAIIIGPGENIIKKLVSKYCSEDELSRITILGPLPNSEIARYLKDSKIFLSSSRFESFGIAAAEACSLGNSLVSYPLEPFEYLTNLGNSGTLASTMDFEGLLTALYYESEMWEVGKRNPVQIASFWREKLNRRNIARKFVEEAFN